MKKIMFAAAVAVAVLLSGCKQASTSNIETIESDALDITAKALPGFNYVTWSVPVDGSTVKVYRDDGRAINPVAGSYYSLDTDVQDGVEYTYTVYTTNPSTADWQFKGTNVTTLNDVDTLEGVRYVGNSASDSCTAINPTYIRDGKLMEALELCEYEEGCDTDYVINPENIILEEIQGKITVAFPTKNYLSYTAELYKGNGYELFGRDYAIAESISGTTNNDAVVNSFYSNNGSYRYDTRVTNAGTYFVEVTVTAQNSKAYSPSYVKSEKTIELAPLDTVTGTGNPVVGYIDAGKTARLVWTPAVKSDTTKWAAESYKVYIKDSKGVYTEIAPAKTAKLDEDGNEVEDDDGNVVMETKLAINAGAKAGDDVYYIDYAIADNKVSYDFYVVLSDNGKYESLSKSATLAAYAELSKLYVNTTAKQIKTTSNGTTLADYAVSLTDLDKGTGSAVANNDVILSFANVNKDLVIKSVKYKKVAMNDNNTYTPESVILDAEIKDAVANPAEYSKQAFIVKNVENDSKVVFLVTVNAKGTNGKEAYKDTMFVVLSDAAYGVTPTLVAGEYSSNVEPTAPTADKTVKVTFTPGTYEKNAQFAYTAFYAKVVDGASYTEITNWTAIPVTIAYDTTASTWKGTSAAVTLAATTPDAIDNKDGTATSWKDSYVIKYVKTNNADTTKFDVKYETINVTKTK